MRSSTILLAFLVVATVLGAAQHPSQAGAYGTPVLILAVHPASGPDWEHAHLMNPSDDAIDLSGWRLDDGEGWWELPLGTVIDPGQRLAVAVNATAYSTLWGRQPDVLATGHGRFGLADRGDSLALLDASGVVVDQLWYGAGKDEPPHGWSGVPVNTPSTMPWGMLLQRRGSVDTDTAGDWTGWTEPRCGWLEVPVDITADANATCFVTPDAGWAFLSRVLSSAEDRIDVAVYDLTSWDLAALLADRAASGVRTRLLLEGRPVGATDEDMDDRARLVAALREAGVEVWATLATEKGVRHSPYRYNHEKYCIVDGRWVVVTTENWCLGSFPPPGAERHGSRGWGAVVDSWPLADALASVFEHDLAMAASVWEPRDVEPLHLPSPRRSGDASALVPCRARLMVGPEAWGSDVSALVDLLGTATESIHLELAYLEVRWGTSVSPLVEALLDAASGGVEVRLVLDPGSEGGGMGTLEELHVLAAGRRVLNLRGVLATDLPGAERLHAKGAVVDGRTAVLGSLNWGWSSVARNREVVVAVTSAPAVEGFEEAFWTDWNASVSSTPPSVPTSLLMDTIYLWDGPPFPSGPVGAIGRDDGDPEDARDPWSFTRSPTARAVLVLSVFTIGWMVERRFGVRTRFSSRLDGTVGGAARRLFTRPSHRPSGGEAGPGAPPATGPPPGPGPGPPPPPPRGGDHRRPLRVVRLPPP